MALKAVYKSEEEREAWKAVICMETMSSDESCTENGDEILMVHPLPWLSPSVNSFKDELDKKVANEKSPQARRQMKRRVLGVPSNRPKPARELPEWAFI